MFQAFFKRAEATVDQAVARILARVLVAVPFLVAIGFGTAAASVYLNSEFGPRIGNLILAGVFAVVGLLTAAVVELSSRATERVDAHDGFGDEKVKAKPEPEPALNPADRDLMMAALTAVGPMALPPIARLVARNLPLLAVLGAAAFVLSRDAGDGVPESVQAAE